VAMVGPAFRPETGTSVLFQLLVEEMRSSGVIVHVVPIPRGGRHLIMKPFKFLGVLIGLMRVASCVDVITVHVPTLQLSNVALAALLVARIHRRPFIIRKFGGTDPLRLRRTAHALARRTIEQSDVCFVEARGLGEDMQKRLLTEVFWFPNHRRLPMSPLPWLPRMGRFIYVGRVRKEKGMQEIIKAAASLAGRCIVDVFGPCEDVYDDVLLNRCPYIRYKGVIAHSDVLSILSSYNALLLPTYWPGEGYPGVIIEAFMAGLPVIATQWKFIGEMVDETCGALVAPHDAVGLARAMDQLSSDEELTQRLHSGALVKAKEFGCDRWTELFIRTCHLARDNSADRNEVWKRIHKLYQSSNEMVSELAGGYCS